MLGVSYFTCNSYCCSVWDRRSRTLMGSFMYYEHYSSPVVGARWMFKHSQRDFHKAPVDSKKKKKKFIRNISKPVMNSPGTAVCTQGISIHPFTLFVWPLGAFPWKPCQRLKNNSLLTLYVATCCYCRNPIVYAIQLKMAECALHVRAATE